MTMEKKAEIKRLIEKDWVGNPDIGYACSTIIDKLKPGAIEYISLSFIKRLVDLDSELDQKQINKIIDYYVGRLKFLEINFEYSKDDDEFFIISSEDFYIALQDGFIVDPEGNKIEDFENDTYVFFSGTEALKRVLEAEGGD